jgi:hypothetical protein
VQFGVNQVDLPQDRLGRIGCNPRPVLDRPAKVGLAIDPKAGEQEDGIDRRFAERVRRAATHRKDFTHPQVLRGRTLG